MNIHVILQQIVNGLSLGAIYALIAVGFAIIVNVLKFSNFAHGGVLGISAYAGYLAANQFNLSLIPVILVGMATGAVVAVLVEFVAFRWIRLQKGQLVYFFVTSVTMLMLLEQILIIRFGSFFDTYPYDLIAVKTLKIGELDNFRDIFDFIGCYHYCIWCIDLCLEKDENWYCHPRSFKRHDRNQPDGYQHEHGYYCSIHCFWYVGRSFWSSLWNFDLTGTSNWTSSCQGLYCFSIGRSW